MGADHQHKSWYAIQCKVHQDDRAEENLLRQGFVCYRPKCKREKLLRGRRRTTDESLFPGYLFVLLSLQDNWLPLRSTRGVLKVVGFGNQPLAVSHCLIDQIKVLESQQATGATLNVGELVHINEGPFANLQAIFLEMNKDERVVLLLTVLQRQQRIGMPLSFISRA